MKSLRISAALGVVGVFALAPAPAGAITADAFCSQDSHDLSATQNFSSPDGLYHRWYKYDFVISGSGTGGESNVIIRLRADGVDKWGTDYTSVNQGQHYDQDGMGGTPTLKMEDEYVLFRGIFDVFGPDPSCNGYTRHI